MYPGQRNMEILHVTLMHVDKIFNETRKIQTTCIENFYKTSIHHWSFSMKAISSGSLIIWLHNLLTNSSIRTSFAFLSLLAIYPTQTIFNSEYWALSVFCSHSLLTTISLAWTIELIFFSSNFNELTKIRLRILRKATLLHKNRKLPEMKVSGSHNKKFVKWKNYKPNFWLYVIMNNAHGIFS